MKLGGIVLAIIGAICTTVGIVKTNSWEYRLANAFGAQPSGVGFLLYGGIVIVIVGIILIAKGIKQEKGGQAAAGTEDTEN